MTVLSWLQQNAQWLNVIINFGVLLVWLLYAQLLFNNYRRQRRPRLLINQGAGTRMSTRCVICNMSEEAIFVEFILAVLRTDKGERVLPVTDETTGNDRKDVAYAERGARQGPVRSGDCLDVGSFEDIYQLISRAPLDESGESSPVSDEEEVHSLEIQVVAIYGSEDMPVGAKRNFKILHYDDYLDLRPETVATQSYLSRRERRRMQDLLKRFL